MRQHLYKAQRIDNNEWVFGSLIIDGEDYYILPKPEDMCEADYPYFSHEFGIIDGKIIPVISETVCEYVGKWDKHGTKIFENDILSAEYGYKGLVKFEEFIYWAFGECCFDENAEVIGNVFDNPELLNKGE